MVAEGCSGSTQRGGPGATRPSPRTRRDGRVARGQGDLPPARVERPRLESRQDHGAGRAPMDGQAWRSGPRRWASGRRSRCACAVLTSEPTRVRGCSRTSLGACAGQRTWPGLRIDTGRTLDTGRAVHGADAFGSRPKAGAGSRPGGLRVTHAPAMVSGPRRTDMPGSRYEQIETVVDLMVRLDPRRILDVGVGNGLYGLLARQYVEGAGPFARNGLRVDGIEIFESYLTPVQRTVYDELMVGDVLEILPDIPSGTYDLALALDVIEHLPDTGGRELLRQL